jgi:hypothetical protein
MRLTRKVASETDYSVKAAKTKAPISTANAKAIRASKNLAIQINAELACSFGLFRLVVSR